MRIIKLSLNCLQLSTYCSHVCRDKCLILQENNKYGLFEDKKTRADSKGDNRSDHEDLDLPGRPHK